jgi:hypothetical protein
MFKFLEYSQQAGVFMDVSTLQNAPINIDLLYADKKIVSTLEEVKEGQIFDNTNNFHQEGLFSTTIFGNIGTEYRNRVFGYIDLKTEILHPLIYHSIISLKSFYQKVLSGSETAIWNPKTKEFERSTDKEAQTGFTFFMSHIEELKFTQTKSTKRKFLIDLFNNAIKENKHKLRYMLVMPAGIRDYTVDKNGSPQEDEINSYYRKLIFQSSIIDPIIATKTPEVYDHIKFSLQKQSLELFEYIKSLLEGKHKLILSKWLTRKVFNTTRNVFSAPIEKADNINDPNRLGYNECFIGLYQYMKNLIPKSLFEIKNNYLKDIFIEGNNIAYLTNAKTLKKELVENSKFQKEYDMWTTSDGLEKIIANFQNLDIRHLPVKLNGGKHYLGLIYNDGKVFKFFQDITELPEHLNKDHVSPITITEILYISLYRTSGKYPNLITRYPITGYGSIYPVMMKLKTTIDYETLTELDDEWNPSDSIAYSFPKKGSDFFNTFAVPTAHFAIAGLDLDGDAGSSLPLLTDESIEEVTNFLKKREYYISPDNHFYFSIDTDTLSAVLSYMTE